MIDTLPLVPLDPPQRPAAAQAATFVVFQETVTEVPGETAAGVLLPLTRKSTVGEAGGGGGGGGGGPPQQFMPVATSPEPSDRQRTIWHKLVLQRSAFGVQA